MLHRPDCIVTCVVGIATRPGGSVFVLPVLVGATTFSLGLGLYSSGHLRHGCRDLSDHAARTFGHHPLVSDQKQIQYIDMMDVTTVKQEVGLAVLYDFLCSLIYAYNILSNPCMHVNCACYLLL